MTAPGDGETWLAAAVAMIRASYGLLTRER